MLSRHPFQSEATRYPATRQGTGSNAPVKKSDWIMAALDEGLQV